MAPKPYILTALVAALAWMPAARPALAAQAGGAALAAVVKAAGQPDPAHLAALLDAGAPVNGRAGEQTPLQAAAAQGLGDNVSLLLARGADINVPSARGVTALGWAARNDHPQIVRMLLDAGADPDAAAGPTRAPLPLAVARGHADVVRLLLERGSKAFEKPELAAAVLHAVDDETGADVAGLVGQHVAGLADGSEVLRDAAADAVASGNTAQSQALLQSLAPASASPMFLNALLFAAVRRGRVDLATTALQHGADVNAIPPGFGSSPLSAAVARGDAQMIALLLSANADAGAAGVDKARLAAVAGDVLAERRATELLERVDAIDARDEHGQTMLFRAAARGDLFAVEALLGKHADPAATVSRWPGDGGWTPLMIAAAGGQTEVVARLLAAGAPVDQRNASGRTALSFAAWYGRAAVAAALLAAGADPDAADLVGQTPIFLAQAGGDTATIALLRSRSTSLQRSGPASVKR